MAVWGRLMSAITGAWNGAAAGWSGVLQAATEGSAWDTHSARVARYVENTRYYNNNPYGLLLTQALQTNTRPGLYKSIRGVRNPVARQVDLYVSKVYPGTLDLEEGTTGAVPLSCDPKLAQAIIELWKSSNWGTGKGLYTHHGALLGDSFIKLVDDHEDGYVCLELLHPGKVFEWTKDSSGNITRIVIAYDMVEDTTQANTRYKYTEVITEEMFATFRDDKPYDYFNNLYNGAGATWENPYGFVPVVQAQHHNLGFDSGASAFHTSLTKIDELNDASSLLNDQIRKVINPIWFATKGAAGNVDLSQTEKDKFGIIYGAHGSTLTPMVAPLDIVGALANIETMEDELVKDMPELALYNIRSQGAPSGVAVRMLYSDATTRITGAAANYDDALARAQSMGVAMGAYHRYQGYQGFKLADYKNGNLYHSIKQRSVLDETIDKGSRVSTLLALQGQPPELVRLIMGELDFSEATIDSVVSALQADIEQARSDAAAGFGKSMFGDDIDDETSDKTRGNATQAAIPTASTAAGNRASSDDSYKF